MKKSKRKKTTHLNTTLSEEVKHSHEQIMKALYFMQDMFERPNVNMLLIGETAKHAKEGSNQESPVTVAIRDVDCSESMKGMIDIFAMPKTREDSFWEYEVEGVPVVVSIVPNEHRYASPNRIMYEYEQWCIPN